MNILLLGSGGRECAIAWKLKQSSQCHALFIAPGNAGTALYGTNVPLKLNNFESIKDFCLQNDIEILFPGGEDTLVAGIYNFIKNNPATAHIIVAGPSKEGAQLEGSKAFSKKFMQRHNIPTAAYAEFTIQNFDEGITYLQQHALPIVLKADGLAAGKGVIIAQSHDEAIEAFTDMIKNAQFGEASRTVVVEQFLDGIELSVFAFSDGNNFVILPEAKDYKRIGEGDTGLNTGGMGAISPVPFADDAFMQKVINRIVVPTVNGLRSEGIVYKGFIFVGLIKVNGQPLVIEYNCRLGDPETEVVMPRLQNDLVEMILAMENGSLNSLHVQQDARCAATVMLVAGGYPGSYAKGHEIGGFEACKNSLLFHAGTAVKDGNVISNGGRLLAITSYGNTLKEALHQSYINAQHINYLGKYYRRDIGYEFI